MSMLKSCSRRGRRWIAAGAGVLTLVLLVIACGAGEGAGSGDDEGFQKIAPSDRSYTFEDLLTVGFIKSRQYDVEGLPEASDAWHGFWGPDPYSRKDYELRFYASHEDAVEYGTALADEVTGSETLRANKDNLTWEAGKKEWWIRTSVIGIIGGAGAQNTARYGDFAIFGNIVMLCEGQDSSVSLDACEGLVNALRETEDE